MGGANKLLMLLSTPFPLVCPRPAALRLASRHSRVSLACLSSSVHPCRSFPSSPASCSRPSFSVRASEQVHTQAVVREDLSDSVAYSPNARLSHHWPEWSSLVNSLRFGGYFDRYGGSRAEDDAFAVSEDLPEDFTRAASACLLFARERPELLRSLSKKDVEVVVENGSAFLFKSSVDSTRRLRSFLASNGFDVLEVEKAGTVDLMRFLLSYACNPMASSHEENFENKELLEASVCNLMKELVNLSRTSRQFGVSEPVSTYGQPPRPFGQNIEMKRGDWICQKCNFMNFARNMKCLDCKEDRPKRVLTGGEWECPQCDFFNYGRNAVCLRCDCKRPGGSHISSAASISGPGYSQRPSMVQPLNGNNSNQAEIERRLAANDEKAERWFSKVSHLDNASDINSGVADEDFPEIMPLRKGVNRFVVSTRKTPLERRLANGQYGRNLGNGGSPQMDASQELNKTSRSSISESLDRILGRVSAASETDKIHSEKADVPAPAVNKFGSVSTSSQHERNLGNQRRDSGHVPFVPLSPDMFAKPKASKTEEELNIAGSSTAPEVTEAVSSVDTFLSEKPENGAERKNLDEQSNKTERWYKKVAELDNVTDLASAISDEDFPEIMPMRKGENRFVVSKKKDRSLTSPQYKRRLAMEQASSSNYVPFVPFPPDYFAKKDKQPDAGTTASSLPESSTGSDSSRLDRDPVSPDKDESQTISPSWGVDSSSSRRNENQQISGESRRSGSSIKNTGDPGVGTVFRSPTENSSQHSDNVLCGLSSAQQQGNNLQSNKDSWDRTGFTGKSLEGSAVVDPDPLDMSEEAKAARWFRRVQQINDISELANIPDEDFPSIMPMRKGVNRFVVSKKLHWREGLLLRNTVGISQLSVLILSQFRHLLTKMPVEKSRNLCMHELNLVLYHGKYIVCNSIPVACGYHKLIQGR